MFENIIGQKPLIEELKNSLLRETLPASLLFHGPDYSGKLSTALELARALSCQGEGASAGQGAAGLRDTAAPGDTAGPRAAAGQKAGWNCGCPSCAKHRTLSHPYSLMAGGRYFADEIEASAASFIRAPREATRFLFIRSVRKLIRRYDPVFWETKDPQYKKVQGPLGELEERIFSFFPDAGGLDPEKDGKEIKKILELARTVASSRGCDNISIDQIRRISVWAQETSDSHKIVILENAHRMLDSARNALLKTLEDPPPRCSFILLTSQRGGIIPTILSRVRSYGFSPRGPEESREVLGRIFREESGVFQDLREFFLAWNGNLEQIRQGVRVFLEGIEGRESFDRGNMEQILGKQDNGRKDFRLFLQELTSVLAARYPRETLAADPSGARRLAGWNSLFRDTLAAWETYNQSPQLLAEGLYYAMRDGLAPGEAV